MGSNENNLSPFGVCVCVCNHLACADEELRPSPHCAHVHCPGENKIAHGFQGLDEQYWLAWSQKVNEEAVKVDGEFAKYIRSRRPDIERERFLLHASFEYQPGCDSDDPEYEPRMQEIEKSGRETTKQYELNSGKNFCKREKH